MRRNKVIAVLCFTVCILGFHSAYQSWSIVHVGDTGHVDVILRDSAIEVIADDLPGSNLSGWDIQRNVHDLHSNGSRLNNERSIMGLVDEPGRLRRSSYKEGRANKANMRDVGDLDYRAYRAESEDVDAYSHQPFQVNTNKTNCHFSAANVTYKVVNGTKRFVPIWQRRLEACDQLGRSVNGTWQFFLTEVLQVRIYENDKAKWSIRELKQWIHFILLAGVEHIFLCDHYMYDSERLDVPLKRYIDLGLITYFPWSAIRNAMQAQVRCYNHIIDNYKVNSRWHIAIDMDEYPFALQDFREGFLVRYIGNLTSQYGNRITEISLSNYLMLGEGDRSRDIVIDRINRMTPKPANGLVKPIYRPERVRANIHHNVLLSGTHLNADTDVMRMMHYWGARTQDWGPDTPETIA